MPAASRSSAAGTRDCRPPWSTSRRDPITTRGWTQFGGEQHTIGAFKSGHLRLVIAMNAGTPFSFNSTFPWLLAEQDRIQRAGWFNSKL